MPKLSELQIRPPNILLYGAPGSGKSLFSGTGGKYVRLLDVDSGMRSLVTTKDEWHETRQEIDVRFCFDEDSQRPTSLTKTKAEVQKIRSESQSQKLDCKIVVLDSLTLLVESSLRHITNTQGRLGRQPQIQDYQQAYIEVENIIMTLLSVPVALIVTAHQYTNTIDEENKLQAAIPGQKLGPKLEGKFDEIWYAKILNKAQGKTERVIQTQGTSSIVCKTRSNLRDSIPVSEGLMSILKEIGYDVEK